jgi:pSer/pThr/pTyr-binding forkhead associated (FHA) protein
MQVKLRVIGGKNDGREIKISVPEFVIGRGEGTHLRPQSDLISRRHCSVVCEGGRAVLKDFGSRNGTYINGERVEGEQQLKPGDRLRVGRLQFEVLIDVAVAGQKRPKVEGVKEAAMRTATGGAKPADGVDEDSITDWLMEADEPSRPKRPSSTETRQFILDQTDHIQIGKKESEKAGAEDVSSEDSSDEGSSDEDSSDEESTKISHDSSISESPSKSSKKKREPGKLPNRPKDDSIDSRDAATQVLRKFFNRR